MGQRPNAELVASAEAAMPLCLTAALTIAEVVLRTASPDRVQSRRSRTHHDIMSTYYSNLIEGHQTPPRDIEHALSGELDQDKKRHDLQLEAKAHVRVQVEVDKLFAAGHLPDPTSLEFILYPSTCIESSIGMRRNPCCESRERTGNLSWSQGYRGHYPTSTLLWASI